MNLKKNEVVLQNFKSICGHFFMYNGFWRIAEQDEFDEFLTNLTKSEIFCCGIAKIFNFIKYKNTFINYLWLQYKSCYQN